MAHAYEMFFEHTYELEVAGNPMEWFIRKYIEENKKVPRYNNAVCGLLEEFLKHGTDYVKVMTFEETYGGWSPAGICISEDGYFTLLAHRQVEFTLSDEVYERMVAEGVNAECVEEVYAWMLLEDVDRNVTEFEAYDLHDLEVAQTDLRKMYEKAERTMRLTLSLEDLAKLLG